MCFNTLTTIPHLFSDCYSTYLPTMQLGFALLKGVSARTGSLPWSVQVLKRNFHLQQPFQHESFLPRALSRSSFLSVSPYSLDNSIGSKFPVFSPILFNQSFQLLSQSKLLELDGSSDINELEFSSILKKRRTKMNRHKLKKRRKRDRRRHLI